MIQNPSGLRGFAAELKRRKVFQVVVAYAAVAFVVLQAGSLLAEGLRLPEWAFPAVTALAILGFPFAVSLAWVFDVTPQGVVRTGPAAEATTMEPPRERAVEAPGAREDREPAHRRSIAVLPFVNMSADPENEFFSDGITEELLNRLARMPGLRVAARTSSFAFKGKNESIRRIGAELGVEAVLEGSVRKSGDRLRITAQLVDVADGFQLWSESYDRQLVDVFAIQEETARAVVGALEVQLSGTPPATAAPPTRDPHAHDLFLRGRHHFHQASGDGLRKAIDYFRQAIAHDPGYAPAHAALAIAYCVLPIFTSVAEREVYPKAKAAALRALEIDEELPDAHAALGYMLLRLEWDWSGAERHFRRALELNPSSAQTHQLFSEYLVAQDRLDEAFFHLARSEELDPLSLTTTCDAAMLRYLAGDYDGARERLEGALDRDPDFFQAHWYLGLVYCQLGRHTEAVAALERTVELCGGSDLFRAFLAAYGYAPAGRRAEAEAILDDLRAAGEERRVTPAAFSLIYASLDDRDQALHWLERAIEERAIPAFVLPREPVFAPLRSDPRYAKLLETVGLA